MPEPSPPAGGLSAIHQGLDDKEALWHLRAGLNVAALSCPSRVGGENIISDYNAFLSAGAQPLAASYRHVLAGYDGPGAGGQQAFDREMTRLYNHFARPEAQDAFCALAAREVHTAAPAVAGDDIGWARPMLARLDQPFTTNAAAVAMPIAAKAEPARPQAPAASTPWRIQLGAYGSRSAAERAWGMVRGRNTQLARMGAHYEAVPGRPLVRLQVRGVASRDQAVVLCAQAAAAGVDCLPLRTD